MIKSMTKVMTFMILVAQPLTINSNQVNDHLDKRIKAPLIPHVGAFFYIFYDVYVPLLH